MSNKRIKSLCGAYDRDRRVYCNRVPGHDGDHKGSKIVGYTWTETTAQWTEATARQHTTSNVSTTNMTDHSWSEKE